jgi:hypothetical protein
MRNAILIETPFASATQTAKILGVSKSRKRQLVNMLKISIVGPKVVGKSKKADVNGRLSSKKHASKKTRSSKSGNSSH